MGRASVWFQRGRIVVLGTLLILMSSTSTSWGQGARPTAKAGGAQSASLARYVPQKDLFLYLEFDGVDAHATAWNASAASKLLNETKLGALLEDLASQGIELAQQSVPPAKRIKGVEVVGVLKNLARQGFVIAVAGANPEDARLIVVLRRGDRPDVRRLLATITAVSPAGEGNRQGASAPIRKGARTLNPLGKEGSWWVEKGDLILTVAKKVDEVLAVIDGKQPSAVGHPLRTKLTKTENGFEPVAAGFVDLTWLPSLPPEAVKFGLDGAKRVELQWGFQDNALMSVLRVVAPSPRRGALALLDQPTFGISSLPPLPSNLTGFTVLSVDLVKTYDQIVALAKLTSPAGDARVANFEDLMRQRLSLDLRGDLFRNVGPKLAFYAQPAAPNQRAEKDPTLALLMQFTGLTISVQVRDQVAASKAVDSLIETLNSVLMAQPPAPNAAPLQFQKLAGPRSKYELDMSTARIAPQLAATYKPTVIVGEDQLVIGATGSAAERALARGRSDQNWRPTGAFLPMTRRLPANLVFLNVSDPRDSLPALVEKVPTMIQQANAAIGQAQRQAGRPGGGVSLQVDPDKVPRPAELRRWLFPASAALAVDAQGVSFVLREPIPSISSPSAVAVAVALLLPAVQASREAARRVQCTNNLKQIGLAFHNYHAANNAFPRAAITDKQGKPLLSWRVAILPYIEQQELYNKFKLDEPWDSPHNKALLKEMPTTYVCPSRSNAEPFATTYQVFSGKGAMFENGQDIGIVSVTDGTSNTLLVVEAKAAVPWTKPADLTFDPEAAPSLNGAGSPHPGGFNSLFGDGSVRFIKNSVNLDVFRALITRNAGEVINADAF
jgi:prepilin-type processing-associated H-X9-DG protein